MYLSLMIKYQLIILIGHGQIHPDKLTPSYYILSKKLNPSSALFLKQKEIESIGRDGGTEIHLVILISISECIFFLLLDLLLSVDISPSFDHPRIGHLVLLISFSSHTNA